jgi:DegV family protein with EDD domain
MTVAIVTDSGSDLTPAELSERHIIQVPLSVSFDQESFRVPDELKPDAFWQRMTAPESPFAHTAAPSAGQFKQAFEQAFAAGADGIVCVTLGEKISATIQSARMAAEMLPGRQIEVVDSASASMAIGALALRGASLAATGATVPEIASALDKLRTENVLFVCLETLEYLRKGGRISHVKAAIGGLLSVKPVMTVEDGLVIPVDQPRTRARARDRILELMGSRPATELHLLYAPPADIDAFGQELLARLPEPKPKLVTSQIIGPVIGAHVGPGAYGGVIVWG